MPTTTLLTAWGLDEAIARERMYRAPTARERERWHAVWLVSQGWSAARVARSPGNVVQPLCSTPCVPLRMACF